MESRVLAVAILAFSPVPVMAADLPSRAPPPVYAPPPIFTWTGFYVGINAGGIFTNSGHGTASGDPVFVQPAINSGIAPSTYSTNNSGFIGGGQIGYNWQMGALVAGLEADFQGTTLSKNSTFATPLAVGSLKSSLDWLSTARGRLGYAFNERFLLYATGGLAYGEFKLRNSLTLGAAPTLFGSRSTTNVGWTIGGGLEYALTPNWSVKGEYLYYDLGRSTVTGTNAAFPGASVNVRQADRGSIVRAGLNYRF